MSHDWNKMRTSGDNGRYTLLFTSVVETYVRHCVETNFCNQHILVMDILELEASKSSNQINQTTKNMSRIEHWNSCQLKRDNAVAIKIIRSTIPGRSEENETEKKDNKSNPRYRPLQQ